jgi:leucyl-tRNA synthetase
MSDDPQHRAGVYDFTAIEAKWQKRWERDGTFRAANPGDDQFDGSRPKYYVLDMFPYPSGSGLHVGHPLGYCASDIYARYKRMRGFNVLHPMGFDAFGLPAEQYAIETGVHPAVTTIKNMETYRRQLRMIGFSYDWDREVATCEPEYYKWTQWIFLQIYNSWYNESEHWTGVDGCQHAGRARRIETLVEAFESGRLAVDDRLQIVHHPGNEPHRIWADLTSEEKRRAVNHQRLAYIDDVAVNWCPALGTVLSNEEVTDEGLSERGNHPVYRRPMRQWMMRITKYADRLLADLDGLDWPDPIKLMQRNWIGRSTGAEVEFALADHDGSLCVYTTRPDTLFGATYMVIAPEHPLIARITTDDRRGEVTTYIAKARHRSDLDRTADTKEKTGVFTGSFAINPVNGERIPIWVADYVLMSYGTGAIMAVPGGDMRDFEFAKAYDLPIIAVVDPSPDWCEKEARLPGGTLPELRADVRKTIEQSIERWHCENATFFDDRIEAAKKFLEKHGNDANISADSIRNMYLVAPSTFAEPFTGEGIAVASPPSPLDGDFCDLNGLKTPDAKKRIIDWLESKRLGKAAVNYKLRDWVFSRQKYWGEPFPILHDQAAGGEIVPLNESDLPLTLPDMKNFKPTPVDDDSTPPLPPLGRATEWRHVERDGRVFQRDYNTMPQWAGSCWYYLRYLDSANDKRFASEEAEKYWMPVDLYIGGAEHAVLHLLYARFWHKVLFDLGDVTTAEPFMKLVNQGMIQGYAYKDSRGAIVAIDLVEERAPDQYVLKETGETVEKVVAKMSKSLKNVVNPDSVIEEYGADTFRMYEMFMGPIETAKPWNTRDVPGLFKLLNRVWRLVVDEMTGEISSALQDIEPTDDDNRWLHKTIKRVTTDVEAFKFHTAIAAIFDFVNAMTRKEVRPRRVIESFIHLLSPFAPHIADELSERLGRTGGSIAHQPWPEYDEDLAADNEVEIAVQILGKVKARIMVPADADADAMEAAARADDYVAKQLEGKTVRKVIAVPGRLINFVVT